MSAALIIERNQSVLVIERTTAALSIQKGDGRQLVIQRDGVPGKDGGGGEGSAAINLVCDAALAAGMPLAISLASGHFVKADAATKAIAFVVALAKTAVAAGFAVDGEPDQLTLSDWTAVTGAAALSRGQIYFLGAGGGLTTIPQSTPNCSTVVGEAITTTTLKISPQPPIKL